MRRAALLLALLGTEASSPAAPLSLEVLAPHKCSMVEVDQSLSMPTREMSPDEVALTVGGTVLCVNGRGTGCNSSSSQLACTEQCLATPNCNVSYTWRSCGTALPNCVLSGLRMANDSSGAGYLPPELRAPLYDLFTGLDQTRRQGCNLTRLVHLRGCGALAVDELSAIPRLPPPPPIYSREGGSGPPRWLFELAAGAALLLCILVSVVLYRLRQEFAPARPRREVILLPLVADNLSDWDDLRARERAPMPLLPRVVRAPDACPAVSSTLNPAG